MHCWINRQKASLVVSMMYSLSGGIRNPVCSTLICPLSLKNPQKGRTNSSRCREHWLLNPLANRNSVKMKPHTLLSRIQQSNKITADSRPTSSMQINHWTQEILNRLGTTIWPNLSIIYQPSVIQKPKPQKWSTPWRGHWAAKSSWMWMMLV